MSQSTTEPKRTANVPQHVPSERAADAAFYAAWQMVEEERKALAKGMEPRAPQDLAAKVRQAVQEAAATMPSLEWFPECVAPGQNADVTIRLSLNGQLIVVERGKREDGQPSSSEEKYGLNWKEFNALLARLLDLVDATFTDKEQREAQKRLVKHAVKEWVAAIVTDAAADARLTLAGSPYVGGVVDDLSPDQIPAHAEGVARESTRG